MPTKLVGLCKAKAVNLEDRPFPYLQNRSNENNLQITLEPAKCILLECLCEKEQYRIPTPAITWLRQLYLWIHIQEFLASSLI